MRRILWLTLLLGATAVMGREGCTVAVVSGRVTADGRPLLWKNRDSSFRNNEVDFFRGVRYDFIGVINAGDTTQVWMGVNTAGLAIMNSESMDQPGDSADTEGLFMKEALAICGRLDDVERLLKRTNVVGRGTRANFGCMDAYGGAAFFETGNRSFVRIDAGDTSVTRDGFLVRANFSMTGEGQEGYGSWRYHRARTLLQAKKQDGLTFDYILRTVCRDLVNDEVDPYPLPFTGAMAPASTGWLNTQNSINRHRTVACAVFHGVKPGERPGLTTMWCLLGEPLCSVAVPLWAVAGPVSDLLDGQETSPLNDLFIARHNHLYHEKKLTGYLDSKRLVGSRSFSERRDRIESEIIGDTEQALAQWRKRLDGEEMRVFQNEQIRYVMRRF